MTPIIFLGAYVVDIIVGDPRWLLHPVVIIGEFASFMERKIREYSRIDENNPSLPPFIKRSVRGLLDKKKGGVILWAAVVIPTFFITWGIVEGSFFITFRFGTIMSILIASFTLATRSLYDESKTVIDSLNRGNIEEARKNLSMIVGRDTENLDEKEIIRAVIETVSENLSDGIVAPLFYLAIGGPALAMTYKAVNTLDSMVGYKNERYGDIGWFSAKMDDIFNWIPARLTGALIVIASFILRYNWRDSWKIMRRDGHNHSSPNSGIPEAAVAGSLSIQLGGKIQYFGEGADKPTIGDKIKETDKKDVKKAWFIMFASSFLMAVACITVLWMV
jgi:adenosylcobinamide-phosphate synthase